MDWLPVGALRSFPVPAVELADSVLVIQLGKAFLMLQRQEILSKARSPGGIGCELKTFLKFLKEGGDPKFCCRKVQGLGEL